MSTATARARGNHHVPSWSVWLPKSSCKISVASWHVCTAILFSCISGCCGASKVLNKHDLQGCMFEIVMVDDRPWNRLAFSNMPYWVAASLLNGAYAERFGYSFRFVRPWQTQASYPGWSKVMFMLDRLQELARSPHIRPCTWLLYLDADAFVREFDLPLDTFLADLAVRYSIPNDTAIIIAREQNLSGVPQDPGNWPPDVNFLNTGVFLVQAVQAARDFFKAWLVAGKHVVKRRLLTTWPGEQGILTELLLPGSYPDGETAWQFARDSPLWKTFAVVNMTEFNSPYGRFVQHSWGKTAVASALRETSFRDALLRIDGANPDRLAWLRHIAMRGIVRWTPWNFLSADFDAELAHATVD